MGCIHTNHTRHIRNDLHSGSVVRVILYPTQAKAIDKPRGAKVCYVTPYDYALIGSPPAMPVHLGTVNGRMRFGIRSVWPDGDYLIVHQWARGSERYKQVAVLALTQ